MSAEQYDALVKKLMAAIRSSVSCSSTPPQSLLLRAYQDSRQVESEKKEFREILERRYKLVKEFVSNHTSKNLEALPFNSGYFMAFHTKNINAEELRQNLLKEKGIGTISIDSQTLRVAFSSIDEEKINLVYKTIYETADEMSK